MAVTFAFNLKCDGCGAALHYENERPAWQTYDYRVERSDECERAAKFVAEHADVPLDYEKWREMRDDDGLVPPYVWAKARYTDGTRVEFFSLEIPDPYRFVPCPVCDKNIREPSLKGA